MVFVQQVDWWVMSLILGLIVLDYVLGIVGSFVTGTFDSTKMRRGLWHKLAYIAALVFGILLDNLCARIDLTNYFGLATLGLIEVWIIITEAGSILENLCIINPSFAQNGFMNIFSKDPKLEAVAAEASAMPVYDQTSLTDTWEAFSETVEDVGAYYDYFLNKTILEVDAEGRTYRAFVDGQLDQDTLEPMSFHENGRLRNILHSQFDNGELREEY